MRRAWLLPFLMVAGCSAAGGPYPSLQPRAAEAIDPRVPVVRPINDRPALSGLVGRLAALVEQARAGDSAFAPAAAEAERLATSAGGKGSEGWTAAQQALSAAIAAAKPTGDALANIDDIAASALQTQGGIAPNDLAAIQTAAAEASAIDRRQAARIKALQQRLGS